MTLATPPNPQARQPSATARPLGRPSGSSSAPSVQEALDGSYATLESIRYPNGLYLASPSADYSKAWLRDTVYEVFPYLDKPTPHYEQTYHSLLDIHRYHEYKIDAIIRNRPEDRDDYIHARFHPETLREFAEPWGNKQNDATGAILFGLAKGLENGRRVLRDRRDHRLVGKMVHMLGSLRYWEDPDNGIWEEWEEVHASSVGACLGGLLAVRAQGFDVPDEYIEEGRRALDHLLPRESKMKRTDLALLTLIWPYQVTSREQTRRIVKDVEKRLLRERGVIRYEGDSYYSKLSDEHGRDKPREFYHGDEAEWTFGLPWLALAHMELGDREKAADYLRRTREVMLPGGLLPELYYAGTDEPNPNTPLGWSQAMYIIAQERFDIEGRGGRAKSQQS